MILFPLWLHAQDKKNLTEADYDKWHTLASGPVSPDGKWVSYSMLYRDGNDTLFIKNTVSETLRFFPKGKAGKISEDGKWFLCIVNDTLRVIGLKKLPGWDIPGVQDFQLKGNTLTCWLKDSKGALYIQVLGQSAARTLRDVTEYALNDDGNAIAFIRQAESNNSIEVMQPVHGLASKALLVDSLYGFKGIKWNGKGNAFVFYGGIDALGKNSFMGFCRCKEDAKRFVITKMPVPDKFRSYYLPLSPLYLSEDGNKVFFDVGMPEKQPNNITDALIFKHNDTRIPPQEKKTEFWHVWHTGNDTIIALEDSLCPIALPTCDYNYALVYSHDKYLPLHKYNGYYMDLYLMDTKTGNKTLLVEKQLYEYQQVLVSPGGKYIAYFKGREWWLYNIEKHKHTKIKSGPGQRFYDTENDYPHEAPYGLAGWTKDDKAVLVYDKYDLWEVTCSNGQAKRLTKGREKEMVYRVHENGFYPTVHEGFGFISRMHDLQEGIIIQGLDSRTYGYELCFYTKTKGLQPVTSRWASISSISKASASNDFYFMESQFSLSPQLIHVDPTGKRSVVVRSNKQQDNYNWGSSRLISFDACGKKNLKAALFYPAGYDPDKSYPMVVNIYQDKSKELLRYVQPSLGLYDGFNSANLTSRGYFVLMPDIHFIMDKPGKSALECVVAASEAALATASINREKIALMGHSFGGFETCYIASQTNFFRTAIAGSSITDLLSLYLDIDPFHKSNMERFDNGQFRSRIPFTSKEFTLESPLQNAATINIPLLLWAGSEDRLAPTENSIKLHSALWQLGKESTLLLYPGEKHVIENEILQKDLYHKIMGWLDFHLKDSPLPKWLQ